MHRGSVDESRRKGCVRGADELFEMTRGYLVLLMSNRIFIEEILIEIFIKQNRR